jgi:hypothetical protein
MRCAVLSRACIAVRCRNPRNRNAAVPGKGRRHRFAFSIGLTRQGRRAKPSLPKHCQASQGEPPKCTQADHLASHGCVPSAMCRLSPASIPTFEHRRSTGANGSRACAMRPVKVRRGRTLGSWTEGDHVGVMPDMTEPVCSDMHAAPRPGPPGAGRLPLLSIKQRWAAAIFDLALCRGVNEDREAIYRMTVICPSTTTLRDFAMIERAPVREPVRVCPKCDDRTRKTTSAPGQGRGASADQVEPSAMDLEECKCSRGKPNPMKGKQNDEHQRR